MKVTILAGVLLIIVALLSSCTTVNHNITVNVKNSSVQIGKDIKEK